MKNGSYVFQTDIETGDQFYCYCQRDTVRQWRDMSCEMSPH